MLFRETKLQGAFIIEPEELEDERGFFARTWCKQEFEKKGLNPTIVQCNISFNKKKGTLRGMHYQIVPHAEAKLVRCTRGAVHDVIIDLRPESETYKQWFAVALTGEEHNMLYIPERFAHGFLTLEDNTEVFYQMTEYYYAEYSRGIRWNDPAFAIPWPMDIMVISDKDRKYHDFADGAVS